MSDVGFEPTPSYEDQNSHSSSLPESKVNLESGALDHSANLTFCHECSVQSRCGFGTKLAENVDLGQGRTGDLLRVKQT